MNHKKYLKNKVKGHKKTLKERIPSCCAANNNNKNI